MTLIKQGIPKIVLTLYNLYTDHIHKKIIFREEFLQNERCCYIYDTEKEQGVIIPGNVSVV